MSNKEKGKKSVKWKAILQVTDISRREKDSFIYCLLSTDLGISICTSERLGGKVCIFERYLMTGYVHFRKGGTYLVMEEAKVFDGESFRRV